MPKESLNHSPNSSDKKPFDWWEIAHNLLGKKTNEPIKRDFARYPDELKLREILALGEKRLIPTPFLFGRQTQEEYTKSKRKAVEAEIKADPNFLTDNPIIVCAIFGENVAQMIIIDGHHRSRYAPLHGVREIPSLIYSPAQLLTAFQDINSVPELIQMLEREVGEAQTSFRIPDAKQPRLLTGVHGIKDLPFKRF